VEIEVEWNQNSIRSIKMNAFIGAQLDVRIVKIRVKFASSARWKLGRIW
jgi:hypothetical protein